MFTNGQMLSPMLNRQHQFSFLQNCFSQRVVVYLQGYYTTHIGLTAAKCLQDFGIWERGDKMNHGVPELNATSIGMAKV